jgi:hypothetical protein
VPSSASRRVALISKAKLTLVAAVMAAGFASPVFAECLESGAAESCGGGGGSYAQAWPDAQSYHWSFGGPATHAPSGEFGGF